MPYYAFLEFLNNKDILHPGVNEVLRISYIAPGI